MERRGLRVARSSIALFVVSLGLMIWLAFLASSRTLTVAESSLMQFLAVLASVVGTYLYGQTNARGFPNARSAFRRLISVYRGLNHIRTALSAQSDDGSKIAVAQALTDAQLETVTDALSDWEDIVPRDVQDLKSQLDSIVGEHGDD